MGTILKIEGDHSWEFTPLQPTFLVEGGTATSYEWTLRFSTGVMIRRVVTQTPEWTVGAGMLLPARDYTLSLRALTDGVWEELYVKPFSTVYAVAPHINGIDPTQPVLLGQVVSIGYFNLEEMGISPHGFQWLVFKGSEIVYENSIDESFRLDPPDFWWGQSYRIQARIWNTQLGWSDWTTIPFSTPDTRPDTPFDPTPLNAVDLASVFPTFSAGEYNHPYGIGRRHREFAFRQRNKHDTSIEVDSDHYTPSDPFPFNTYWEWRCRDVDITGQGSHWTPWHKFHILPIPTTPSFNVEDFYTKQDPQSVILQGPPVQEIFDLSFVRRVFELNRFTTLHKAGFSETDSWVVGEPLEYGATYFWRFKDEYLDGFTRGWSDYIELKTSEQTIIEEPMDYWDKKYLFWIPSGGKHYPQLSQRHGLITELNCYRFPGVSDRVLVTYQVAHSASKTTWLPLTSGHMNDGVWFSFIQQEKEFKPDRFLQLAHRHFVKEVLQGSHDFSLEDALYRMKNISGLGTDVEHNEEHFRYWDTFHRTTLTNVPSEAGYQITQNLAFKVTRISSTNKRPLNIEPFKTGLYFTVKQNHTARADYPKQVESLIPTLNWDEGFPVKEMVLWPFHLRYPR